MSRDDEELPFEPVLHLGPPRPAGRGLAAWDENARTWTNAHRAGTDRQRRIADAFMIQLVQQVPSGPILDAGCGEGSMTRVLGERERRLVALDGSPEMLEAALEAGHGAADYRLLTFDEAAAEPRRMGGAFGTIVFNFSLLDEKVTPILNAAGLVLFPYGRVLINAAHPSTMIADGVTYRDGWKMMDEVAPGVPVQRRIPWYFRTYSTWMLELRRAGLLLVETFEPLDPDTGRPVSLVIHATIPERRRPKIGGRRR